MKQIQHWRKYKIKQFNTKWNKTNSEWNNEELGYRNKKQQHETENYMGIYNTWGTLKISIGSTFF